MGQRRPAEKLRQNRAWPRRAMIYYVIVLNMLAISLWGAATAAGSVVPINAARPLGTVQTIPRPAVVVLWATWCASCKAELDRLDTLAVAAKPLPIITLAIDPPDKARVRMIAQHRKIDLAFADNRDQAIVLGDWGGKGALLPLAVAIDRSGQVCGMKRGLLGTDQLRAWAKTCSK